MVHASNAKKFENAHTCTAYEYETKTEHINIARIEIRGRYPLTGSAINTEVCELAYVVQGEGKVSINGSLVDLTKGTVVLIEKGEGVWWEGTLDLLIASAPAWTKEQYKEVV